MGGSGIFIGNFYPREDGLVRRRKGRRGWFMVMRWRDEGMVSMESASWCSLTSCPPGGSRVSPDRRGCLRKW